MAIDFPTSPAVNDTVTAGNKTWRWTGSVWESVAKTFPAGLQGLQGAQGSNGVQAARGLQGILGIQGATGRQGSQGTTGAQGAQGFTGTQGLTAYSRFLPHTSGNYYTTIRRGTSTVTNPVQNRSYFIPFFVPNAGFYSGIACRTISTHTSTTSTVRMGIYNNDGGVPSTVLLDAGTIVCSAASTTYEIPINQFLNVGFYWLAWNRQDSSTNANFEGISNIERTNGLLGLPYGTATPATLSFSGRAFCHVVNATTSTVPEFTTVAVTSLVFPNNIVGPMVVLKRL